MASKSKATNPELSPSNSALSEIAQANSQRLIEIDANRLTIATLHDVSSLIVDKMKANKDRIDELAKNRETKKSFATFREINALRESNKALALLSASFKRQLTELRANQGELLKQAEGK